MFRVPDFTVGWGKRRIAARQAFKCCPPLGGGSQGANNAHPTQASRKPTRRGSGGLAGGQAQEVHRFGIAVAGQRFLHRAFRRSCSAEVWRYRGL